jgi:hypothetical protein
VSGIVTVRNGKVRQVRFDGVSGVKSTQQWNRIHRGQCAESKQARVCWLFSRLNDTAMTQMVLL